MLSNLPMGMRRKKSFISAGCAFGEVKQTCSWKDQDLAGCEQLWEAEMGF